MCYHIEREVMYCSTYTSSRSTCLGAHGTGTLEALLAGLCISSIFQLTNMLEKCNFPWYRRCNTVLFTVHCFHILLFPSTTSWNNIVVEIFKKTQDHHPFLTFSWCCLHSFMQRLCIHICLFISFMLMFHCLMSIVGICPNWDGKSIGNEWEGGGIRFYRCH